jgi:gluconokinase
MGVSGAGKSTLAAALSERLGWDLLEADDLHPLASVAKMRRGEPLTDADRAPWLAAVARSLDARGAEGRSCVIACSALRRSYRDTLSAGRASLRLVYLEVDRPTAAARVGARRGHYMPASLVESQFATLEPPRDDEQPIVVDAASSTARQVEAVIEAMGEPQAATFQA